MSFEDVKFSTKLYPANGTFVPLGSPADVDRIMGMDVQLDPGAAKDVAELLLDGRVVGRIKNLAIDIERPKG